MGTRHLSSFHAKASVTDTLYKNWHPTQKLTLQCYSWLQQKSNHLVNMCAILLIGWNKSLHRKFKGFGGLKYGESALMPKFSSATILGYTIYCWQILYSKPWVFRRVHKRYYNGDPLAFRHTVNIIAACYLVKSEKH